MVQPVDSKFHIRLADWNNPDDVSAVLDMLEIYTTDPRVGNPSLSEFTKKNLASIVSATPGFFVAIGFLADAPVAFNSFYTTLSVLRCKPVVHAQDLVVLSHVRGKGIATCMRGFAEDYARQIGAWGVTKEVLASNDQWIGSNKRGGYEPRTPNSKSGITVSFCYWL